MAQKTKLLTAIAVGATLSVGATAARAADWDMPTPYGATNFHTVNIMKFATDVKEVTGGKVNIKVHPGGSLIKHPEIKNAVRSGQVPIGEFLLSRLANENAVYQVDSIPFLASSYADAKKLWDASMPFIDNLLLKQGIKILYAVPWPPQGLYAKKEIKMLSDLKGVKFRAYNTATATLAKLAGAVPTQVEVPDIPQAFSTGRVGAMITSPSTGANTKAWDFVSHFHHTQGWLPKNVVVVNLKAFGKLTPKQQELIRFAAKRAEERGWKASMEETRSKIAILEKNGMKVVDPPSKTLMNGMRGVGTKMTAGWQKRAGKTGAAILKAYRQ